MTDQSDIDDIREKLDDPWWRITSGKLYKIMIKEPVVGGVDGEEKTLVVPFEPNPEQIDFLKELHTRNDIVKARQLGFCLDPKTRILTADLQWVPIGEIEPGREIIGVDEKPPGRGMGRRMRSAQVVASQVVHRKAYRIELSCGRELICTDTHPWLTQKSQVEWEWRSISGDGNAVTGKITVGTKMKWITDTWADSRSYEDGWFGGMLDGEGSMAKSSSTGGEVNVSQVPGPCFDRMESYLSANRYNYRIEEDNHPERDSKFGNVPVHKLCVSRIHEMFRLIGITRPSRFIGRKFWEGKELPGKRLGNVNGNGRSTVVSITELDYQPMIDLQTTTGTYIAEGFVSHNTTIVAIYFLDCVMFCGDIRAGIIAQSDEVAKTIFRDKVKFAYDNLPRHLRQAMPLRRESASELLFDHNNSSIRVATSVRASTIHYLHVSEFGKICAKFPERAEEIVTGSFPTVPLDGIIIIESTTEGQDGHFFTISQRAKKMQDAGKKLNKKDFKLHFYPWWVNDGYRMDPDSVAIEAKDHKYFDEIEKLEGIMIDLDQRAWWVATRDSEFSGEDEKMWQEYPSTFDEAFKKPTAGCFYAKQITMARKQGRITSVPYRPGYPVNTFWDIGHGDGTAIWLHQRVGQFDNFIGYIEGWEEPYSYYVGELQKKNYVWGRHYLPHDGGHVRQGKNENLSPKRMLEQLGLNNIEIVPAVDNIYHGIQVTRDAFASAWFDEIECAQGIIHLEQYRKRFSKTLNQYINEPVHDIHSEGADAFRQYGQGYKGDKRKKGLPRSRPRPMTDRSVGY